MTDIFTPIIPDCHTERLTKLIDLSWDIFRKQFLAGRHPILKEAPFQHHFANVISAVGSLFCISREDTFLVDLETRIENIRGKLKYIDITCSFPSANTSCAIELKFKTAQQGAQDHGRIDVYTDIEALELVCPKHFTFGRFFMITDSQTYRHKSTRGVGTVFCMHDGHQTPINTPLKCTHSKGRENVVVTLSNVYTFNWEQVGDWHFLSLPVKDKYTE